MNEMVKAKPDDEAVAFWDKLYADDPDRAGPQARQLALAAKAAIAYFGDLKGKTVLDIGCGNGDSSLAFARLGANVVAVDNSKVGIETLANRCRRLGVDNVKPVVCDAMAIDSLGPFDFAFGAMILHHLEPFESFCLALKRSLNPGGRAFFWENNANSKLLIWFRTHVVGRLWVPKYGDSQEFPLTPDEVETLRRHFSVRVFYPNMTFFVLFSNYILRDRFTKPFAALDDWLYRRNWLVKYSYQQYLYLTNR
jgi:2-polyprenyl-3-methyl-5-hydroxy-6-metoxy-1,4-benzoquinol methylase